MSAPIEVGTRVVTPDPVKLNPFGSPPGPHGPGEIVQVDEPRYENANRMLTVKLDTGEEIRLGEQFVRAESR